MEQTHRAPNFARRQSVEGTPQFMQISDVSPVQILPWTVEEEQVSVSVRLLWRFSHTVLTVRHRNPSFYWPYAMPATGYCAVCRALQGRRSSFTTEHASIRAVFVRSLIQQTLDSKLADLDASVSFLRDLFSKVRAHQKHLGRSFLQTFQFLLH